MKLAIAAAIVCVAGAHGVALAQRDLAIWDGDAAAWTSALSAGDPIDHGGGLDSSQPEPTADGEGRVYVAFVQAAGAESHIYLSRYDGKAVQIWDNDAPGWTADLAEGDPIDRGGTEPAFDPQVAVDGLGRVYVAFTQWSAADSYNHSYLSRYDGTDVRIWDRDARRWTREMADGDPIDMVGPKAENSETPRLAIDPSDRVYIAYSQDRSGDAHIYLARYRDGDGVKTWDAHLPGWAEAPDYADPVDNGEPHRAGSHRLAADAAGRVYIVHSHIDDYEYSNIFLSRYDGAAVRIWDSDTGTWTTTMADGDPVNLGAWQRAYTPDICVTPAGTVYVAYYGWDGSAYRIYLDRCDGTDVRTWDGDTRLWTRDFAEGDPIDPGPGGSAYNPRLAADIAGRVYISYFQSDGGRFHTYLDRCDGRDVRIWDSDTRSWTTDFSAGDPIGPRGTESFSGRPDPAIAVDRSGRAYVFHLQSDGARNRAYLARCDGAEVRVWDHESFKWTADAAAADPVDGGGSAPAFDPRLAVADGGRVFATWVQSDGAHSRVFLDRFDPAALDLAPNRTALRTGDTFTLDLKVREMIFSVGRDVSVYAVVAAPDGSVYSFVAIPGAGIFLLPGIWEMGRAAEIPPMAIPLLDFTIAEDFPAGTWTFIAAAFPADAAPTPENWRAQSLGWDGEAVGRE